MLYGTRKELNKKLKRMFGNEERYALLVWTKEDVMAQVENNTREQALQGNLPLCTNVL